MTPAWLLSALLAYGSPEPATPNRDTHLSALADAIWSASERAPMPQPVWAKLMLTVAIKESGASYRIFMNLCKPKECDHGRAIGEFQLHRNAYNRDEWAKQPGDYELQARLASEQLKRAYWTCNRSGVPWVQGTLSAYAGQGCSKHWSGLDERVALFSRLPP